MALLELEVEFQLDEQSFEAAFDLLEQEITEIIRGLTVDVWNNILRRTPQFEGRMAASWTYSLNQPEFVDRSSQVDSSGQVVLHDDGANYRYRHTGVKGKGDIAAIMIATEASFDRDTKFKLGDTVFISNGVDHGDGPYALDVEEGRVQLRSINRPGNAVGRTIDQVHSRFSEDMTPQAASIFSSMQLGYS